MSNCKQIDTYKATAEAVAASLGHTLTPWRTHSVNFAYAECSTCGESYRIQFQRGKDPYNFNFNKRCPGTTPDHQ